MLAIATTNSVMNAAFRPERRAKNGTSTTPSSDAAWPVPLNQDTRDSNFQVSA